MSQSAESNSDQLNESATDKLEEIHKSIETARLLSETLAEERVPRIDTEIDWDKDDLDNLDELMKDLRESLDNISDELVSAELSIESITDEEPNTKQEGGNTMSDNCSNCEEPLGYEVGWDDPPKGEGHITVTFNPEDEPAYVVGEERNYCSIPCLVEDAEDLPFELGELLNDTDSPNQDEGQHEDYPEKTANTLDLRSIERFTEKVEKYGTGHNWRQDAEGDMADAAISKIHEARDHLDNDDVGKAITTLADAQNYIRFTTDTILHEEDNR